MKQTVHMLRAVWRGLGAPGAAGSGQGSTCPALTVAQPGSRPPALKQQRRQKGAARRGLGVSICHGQVYIEDSLGERIWVDSPHCKTFVDNIQTAFNTRMPPKSMLLQGETARSGGDLSAGESGRGSGGDGVSRGRGGLHGGQVPTGWVGMCVHEALGLQGAALTPPSLRRRTARLSS